MLISVMQSHKTQHPDKALNLLLTVYKNAVGIEGHTRSHALVTQPWDAKSRKAWGDEFRVFIAEKPIKRNESGIAGIRHVLFQRNNADEMFHRRVNKYIASKKNFSIKK